MKPNLYTQCILTVIAACLVWLCVQGFIKPATARADSPVAVVIKDVDVGCCLGNLPVEIKDSETLPVEIKDSETLPVQIKDQPIDVKVKE